MDCVKLDKKRVRTDGRRTIDKDRVRQHYTDQQRIAELESSLAIAINSGNERIAELEQAMRNLLLLAKLRWTSGIWIDQACALLNKEPS